MRDCYRHPGRETGVSCSNCGRPICPDCMTSTSVGMRCPECAHDRTRTRRGAAAFTPASGPVVTYGLIAANVVAFMAEVFAGGALSVDAQNSRLLVDGSLYAPAIDAGQWYRIGTAGFLHAGPLHLLLNMYALFILGALLEPALGHLRFAAVYLTGLLAGSFGALLLSPDSHTVGASGAIFGLMGAALVIARARGIRSLSSGIGIFILLNLAFTFSVPGISIGGHIGGLIGGTLAALAIAASERNRAGWTVLAQGAVIVVLCAASVAGALWVAGQPTPLL